MTSGSCVGAIEVNSRTSGAIGMLVSTIADFRISSMVGTYGPD